MTARAQRAVSPATILAAVLGVAAAASVRADERPAPRAASARADERPAPGALPRAAPLDLRVRRIPFVATVAMRAVASPTAVRATTPPAAPAATAPPAPAPAPAPAAAAPPASAPAPAAAAPPAPAPASAAAAPPAPAPASAPPSHGSASAATPAPTSRRDALYAQERDARNPTLFRFQVGYGVDQGDPMRRNVSGMLLDEDDARLTRLYTFGDVVLGTDGRLLPSLSTYLASRFFLDFDGRAEVSTVPTIYDATDAGAALLVRSAYAQLERVGPRLLRPLRVRAGRQFRGGLAVSHFDGVLVAYETPRLALALHSGKRVSSFGPGSQFQPLLEASAGAPRDTDPGELYGASVRVRPLAWLPVAVAASTLTLEDQIAHSQLGVDLEPWRTLSVSATARFRDDDLARWHARLRARLPRFTSLSVDLERRTSHDWMYDALVDGALSGEADARRHLLLGAPAVPRTTLSGRAGTVVLRNWDLYVFGGIGTVSDEDRARSTFAPPYVEGGAALDARFRAGLSTGLEGTFRRYGERPEGLPAFAPEWGSPERSYVGGQSQVRYTLGPRRLTADFLLYGRQYTTDDADAAARNVEASPIAHRRSGVILRLDGWTGRRLHILMEYDLAGMWNSPRWPELTSLQSLRVVGEGSF